MGQLRMVTKGKLELELTSKKAQEDMCRRSKAYHDFIIEQLVSVKHAHLLRHEASWQNSHSPLQKQV